MEIILLICIIKLNIMTQPTAYYLTPAQIELLERIIGIDPESGNFHLVGYEDRIELLEALNIDPTEYLTDYDLKQRSIDDEDRYDPLLDPDNL